MYAPDGISVKPFTSIDVRNAFQASPTGPFLDYVGTTGNATTGGPQYKWNTFTTVTYSNGPGSLGVHWRHLPSIDNQISVTNPASPVLGAEAWDNFDLFLGWKISEKFQVRGGVDNLLDRDPPRVGQDPTLLNSSVGNANGVTLPGNYDVLGRRYYFGVKSRF